jgi:N-acetylglucosamine kinase-like BadF-type ATPase
MTIIVDSGSTKTTWMDVKSGNKIVTEGLNPHFTSDEVFLKACSIVREKYTPQPPSRGDEEGLSMRPPLRGERGVYNIFFSGAGCGNNEQRKRVALLLKEAFHTEDVHVETDMLGACRAVSGDEPSLVGILGTGSNACYYDGKKVVYQAFSAGYILGDHGSANHVGRKLLETYLSGRMPYNIAADFHATYPLSHEELIEMVYHRPNPNRFLASLAPFALKNSRYTFIAAMLENCFNEWIRFQVESISGKSKCTDLCIVGGFGKAMESRIKNYVVYDDMPYTIKKIISDPIIGLRKYHLKYYSL